MVSDSNATSVEESKDVAEATSHATEEMTAPEEESATEQATASQERAAVSAPVLAHAPKERKAGKKRAALPILKENVDKLARDVSSFRKDDEASTRKVEKQISLLHGEVGSLKRHISKENTIATRKQEAYLSRILAKLSAGTKTDGKSAKKASRK